MTLPRSAAEVLSEHMVFSLECIDRMYLNMYQPRLQHELGVIGYLHEQLGCPVNSTAPLAKVSEGFAAQIHRFVAQQQVPLVAFVRGQRKDDVLLEHLAAFRAAGRTEGCCSSGGRRRRTGCSAPRPAGTVTGTYPWIVKATGVINQWYFYCVDADFGPFFIKFSGYFPTPASCA